MSKTKHTPEEVLRKLDALPEPNDIILLDAREALRKSVNLNSEMLEALKDAKTYIDWVRKTGSTANRLAFDLSDKLQSLISKAEQI